MVKMRICLTCESMHQLMFSGKGLEEPNEGTRDARGAASERCGRPSLLGRRLSASSGLCAITKTRRISFVISRRRSTSRISSCVTHLRRFCSLTGAQSDAAMIRSGWSSAGGSDSACVDERKDQYVLRAQEGRDPPERPL